MYRLLNCHYRMQRKRKSRRRKSRPTRLSSRSSSGVVRRKLMMTTTWRFWKPDTSRSRKFAPLQRSSTIRIDCQYPWQDGLWLLERQSLLLGKCQVRMSRLQSSNLQSTMQCGLQKRSAEHWKCEKAQLRTAICMQVRHWLLSIQLSLNLRRMLAAAAHTLFTDITIPSLKEL